MKRIILVAGIAASASLAGCDLTGDTNKAEPANVAAPGGDSAAPAPRPFDPFKLKVLQVSANLRVDGNSDVGAFIVMLPAEIMLPSPSLALGGRIYVVHARAGPVTVRADGAGIDGSSRLVLERGQSAILMSDGRDTYLRINPV
jgi:hypothetical protein